MWADVVYGSHMSKLPLLSLALVLMAAGCTSKAAALGALADDSACVVDSDCCAATDGCAATSYAVDRSQAEAASDIIDGNDGGACVRCIAQNVVPSCRAGRCVVTAIGFEDEGPGTDAVDDHVVCLAVDVEVAAAETDTRAIGCGTVDDE